MFGGLIGGATNMKGLNLFISDIRECKDKESQTKRVELELAKIRQRFTTEKGLNAYQRKKYVWKLLYIHILGYEVDFGFQEASGLINSTKYDEKYTGYIACSLFVPESNEQVWKSVAYSVQSDLKSKNEAAQSLALSLLAATMPSSMSSLADLVFDIALNSRTIPNVRKKALLCLSRVIRKDPSKYDLKKVIGPLTQIFQGRGSAPLSMISGAASLLITTMGAINPELLKQIQSKIIRLLHRLAINKQCPSNYLYYSSPNPWLQMKLLKALQIWNAPEDKPSLDLIQECLTKIIKRSQTNDGQNKNNIQYGLLFEAICLTIHYDQKVQKKLLSNVSKILLVFISSSRPNIRYLGLQAMCRFAVRHPLAQHLDKVLVNLDQPDISIRKRALDLLYLICDSQNVTKIVAQLLGYLQNRNDPHIKDDLVLKIAILAQKFAQNLIWYVDVVVELIQQAEVQNDIWYRIIQIITGFGQANPELQSYAALKLLSALHLPHLTNTLICVGSYVVSQFSDYLVKGGKDPKRLFEAINKHFSTSSSKAKAMMLNALAKLAIKYDSLKEQVQMICHLSSQHWDPDVQQRGVEFLALFAQEQTIQTKVVSMNPTFTQQQQQANPLLKKFAKGNRKSKENVSSTSSSLKSSQSTTQSTIDASSFQTNTVINNPATAHPLSNHPAFKLAIDKLSPTLQGLLDLPGKFQLKPYWKQAFSKKQPFQNCQLKQKVQQGILKSILSVSVVTTQMQFKVFRNKGFQVTTSAIKYGNQSQQILLTFTPNGDRIQPPSVGIAWKDAQGQIQKKQVQLPVAISKFLNPVELPYQKFNAFYKEYSLANPKFHKLDSFLKIPQGVTSGQYLKRVGSFLGAICNFKCGAYPSLNDIKVLYGSATFPLKQEAKMTNYPILIQVQCYEVDKKTLWGRLSIRGGHANSLLSVYQLFMAYFG